MRVIPALALASALLTPILANAAVDAYFDNASGAIVIPHLEVGGSVYYATLILTDSAQLVFKADLTKLTDITPPQVGPTVNTDANSIVGKWEVVGSNGGDQLTFNSDGTYVHVVNAQSAAEDTNCSAGTETGTYQWERRTGLMLSRVTSDTNRECGISHPNEGVPLRFFIDGNSIIVLERSQTYGLAETSLVRVTTP